MDFSVDLADEIIIPMDDVRNGEGDRKGGDGDDDDRDERIRSDIILLYCICLLVVFCKEYCINIYY